MKYVDIKNKQGLTEEEFLKQYDDSIYEKPSLTVDMLIFTVMNEKRKITGSFQKNL